MFLFAELAAAAVAMTAAQHAQPTPQHRPASTAPAKAAASRHLAACKRAYPSYNAKTDTYRNARGKPVRCTK